MSVVETSLPEYEVRISNKARSPRIIVRPNRAVEVVLPCGVPQKYAVAFLIEKRAWIARVQQRFLQQPMRGGTHQMLPQNVTLECCGEVLDVQYLADGRAGVQCRQQGQSLCLHGRVDDVDLVHRALRGWLKTRAKQVLPPMLEALAKKHGYTVRKIGVRLQKQRWGSCSGAGNISLNAKLLLLPEALVHHVVLHELAHLRHPNHSAQFWTCVADMDSQCLLHRQQLRHAHTWMPTWITSGE